MHAEPYDVIQLDAINSSASFNLSSSSSLQLIWSKDNVSQCVCPALQEIISECACNKNNPRNMVTISGNTVTVANLTEEMSYVIVYLVSVTAGCQNRCTIRRIMKIYKITLFQRKFDYVAS